MTIPRVLEKLAQNLTFTAWADGNCDNLYNENDVLLFSNQKGPASDVLNGKTYALADSTHGLPLPATSTEHPNTCIGLQWCAGTMTIVDHTISCDGASMGNDTQTDSLTADVAFRIEQSRNNPNFLCVPPIRIDRTQAGFGDGGWAGWSCPAGTTAIGGGIDSSTNPVGGNGVAAPSAPAVDGFNYPVYPHYTFPLGETGYVVHDLVDGLGNTIVFHVLCLPN